MIFIGSGGGVLTLYRNEVSVFYSPSQLGSSLCLGIGYAGDTLDWS